MNKMKKIMENWQRAIVEDDDGLNNEGILDRLFGKKKAKPTPTEDIREKVVPALNAALKQMDDLPEIFTNEVGTAASPERSLFDAYNNVYDAVNVLRKALDDSIIAQDGE